MSANAQQRSALACELIADIVRDFGEVCLKVTGVSMIPALWPGDTITVRCHDPAELRCGQIVLYKRGEKLIAHRITSLHDGFITTRGDSLLQDDPLMTESDIVGFVMSASRNGRCIPLHQFFWQRVCSMVIRHSDVCLRVVLRLGRLKDSRDNEMLWVS